MAVYFGESFAGIFLPDIVKYLPFNAATAVVSTGTGGGGFGGGVVSRLDPKMALVGVTLRLVGAVGVAGALPGRTASGG